MQPSLKQAARFGCEFAKSDCFEGRAEINLVITGNIFCTRMRLDQPRRPAVKQLTIRAPVKKNVFEINN